LAVEKIDPDVISTAAFVGPAAPEGPLVDTYQTGFEPGEGFAPGFIGGQAGWTVFIASTTQPTVSAANPLLGSQHQRNEMDPANGVGTMIGSFSPQITQTDPMAPSTTEIDVFISGLNGADYDVAPQAPTQMALTARVNFRFTGPIRVLDGGVFVDTGATWVPNTWMNLRIEVDPSIPQIDYYIDDVLIYTANALVLGTTVEQVVIFSDNFHLAGEFGDFDNFGINPIDAVPPPIVVEIPTLSPVGIAVLALLLFGAAAGILWRRRSQSF